VFLSDARQLQSEQIARGVKRGVASRVIEQQSTGPEIYASATNPEHATAGSVTSLVLPSGAAIPGLAPPPSRAFRHHLCQALANYPNPARAGPYRRAHAAEPAFSAAA
jgi:hypothetical protein